MCESRSLCEPSWFSSLPRMPLAAVGYLDGTLAIYDLSTQTLRHQCQHQVQAARSYGCGSLLPSSLREAGGGTRLSAFPPLTSAVSLSYPGVVGHRATAVGGRHRRGLHLQPGRHRAPLGRSDRPLAY